MPVLCTNPREIHDAVKEAVVDSILNNLSARLAGRAEFYSVIYGAKPSLVLMSEFLLPVPQEERMGDEEANPIQISAHGLDLQISRDARSEQMAVAVKGAVYVRILPTEDEIKPGGRLAPTFPLTKAAAKELKLRIKTALDQLRVDLGMAGKGSKRHPDWFVKSEEARRKAHESLKIPFDNALDRSSGDGTDIPLETAGDVPTDTSTTNSADSGPSPGATVVGNDNGADTPPEHAAKAGTTLPDALAEAVPPPAKWVRIELELPPLVFKAETCESDAKLASTALNEAIAKQIQTWAQLDAEPYGGRNVGFRHGLKVTPSESRDWKTYLARARASSLPIAVPTIEMRWVVQATPDPLDESRTTLHVALENWTQPNTKYDRKDVEPVLFQVSLSLTLKSASHRPLLLDRVKPSYRYNEYLRYPALGFNGGVIATNYGDKRVLTTTWSPRYVLPRIVPTEYGVQRNIERLSNPDSLPELDPLVSAYKSWLVDVARQPVDKGLEGPAKAELEQREKDKLAQDLVGWRDELTAIETGLKILRDSKKYWSGPGAQTDPRGAPFEAWICMNATMAKVASSKGYSEWRLFQLAFILASLPAFVTRMPEFHPYFSQVEKQARAVTLLYFATGGGKSEAFLGLLAFVLFLDRLRGKLHGVSALMRYPLRLLTLQQSRRTFSVMGAAEEIRAQRKHPGEPFSLGFWVGGSNTPNWHSHEEYKLVPTEKDASPADEDKVQETIPYKKLKDQWLKLDSCPFCGVKGKLALRRWSRDNTMGHFCSSSKPLCSWNRRFAEPTPLPYFIVDEDIYDRAPSVLLGTVDKLSALGQSQGTIRKFFGMFGFAPLIEKSTERLFVPQNAKDWDGEPGTDTDGLYPTFSNGTKRFFDPFPSLLIQDEAHLLDESLGTFAGLFESALEAAFDRLGERLPHLLAYEPNSTLRRKIKVIAASATVSSPERQMRNIYQRDNTVQFPCPGPTLYTSFYAEPKAPDTSPNDVERTALPPEDVELRSHWARLYCAILTNGHRHTVAMASVLGHYHLIITDLYERLRSGDAKKQDSAREELSRWITRGPLHAQHTRVILTASPETLLTLVDLHRIALTYVTNKKGGDQVIDTEKTQFDKLHDENGLQGQVLASELLSGAVSAGEIQAIVRRAEARVSSGHEFPSLNNTLRSVIATSAISHGVDVEEFNAMFFAGMLSDISEYIQASSRVGRTHIGFSLLVPVPQRPRDRFILEVFDIFHRFLERMILPAAVDRWAEKAQVRVMPSFFQEYVCGVNAIVGLCEADDDKKRSAPTYLMAQDVRDFLAKAQSFKDTEDFMAEALGLNVVPAPDGAPYYRARLRNELAQYQVDLGNPRLVNGTVTGRFLQERAPALRPMTSLRDVDEPGIIHESHFDAYNFKVPEDATESVMRFIRRGSGNDLADLNPFDESKEFKSAKDGASAETASLATKK